MEEDVMSLRYGINLSKNLAENWSHLLGKCREALIDEEPTDIFDALVLNHIENDLLELGIDDFEFDNPDYILGLQHAYTLFAQELSIELEENYND